MSPDGRDPSAASGHVPGRPARRVGRFRVEAAIGHGAFSTVYRATDERLEDTVAVKVLAENHSLDADLRERFLTEGRVLRRIDSPHVVRVHDLGEEGQQPFLVLEHLDGGTLDGRAGALWSRGWRAGPADVWAVAEPLAEAVAAVHRAEVVHRDLNPRNVLLGTSAVPGGSSRSGLVREDERLVLADLGLCKDLARSSGYTIAAGTDGFRPPELGQGPALVGPAADIWSLSALVVWLVTGSPPVDGALPTPVVAELPPGLARVLARGLAADQRARPPDPMTWLAAVRDALQAERTWGPHIVGAHPSPPTAPPNMSATVPAARRSGPPAGGPAGPPGWPPVPAAPGGPVAAGVPARPPGPDRGWRLRQSLWLLATVPLGFTTWAGFLYVGLRAGRRTWVVASVVYGAGIVLAGALMGFAPTDAGGDIDVDTWQANAGTAVTLAVWLGGMVHGLVANGVWLRRAADAAERRWASPSR